MNLKSHHLLTEVTLKNITRAHSKTDELIHEFMKIRGLKFDLTKLNQNNIKCKTYSVSCKI